MKNSHDLKETLGPQYLPIMKYDLIEIDNPDMNHPIRIRYIARLNTIVSIIEELFPDPQEIRIGDFACAQCNIGLTLSEKGYKVYAVDLNPLFIDYAKKKYEYGDIEWIVGNIEELDMPAESLNAIIAGELIEHCAYPEEMVAKMLYFLCLGGFLVLTTPNGSRLEAKLRANLPSFGEFRVSRQRKLLAISQFGPDAKDHLFQLKSSEIDSIIPENAEIIKKGYTGGSRLLFNKISWPVLSRLHPDVVQKAAAFISSVNIMNTLFSDSIYCVIRKCKS